LKEIERFSKAAIEKKIYRQLKKGMGKARIYFFGQNL